MGRRNCFMAYVSITGLRVKSIFHAPLFWWHAVKSMAQAKSAQGNISVDASVINGVHHTLTVWQNRDAMRTYLTKGAHLAAMKNFRAIGSGKVLGFEADEAPPWSEVHELWKKQGREV